MQGHGPPGPAAPTRIEDRRVRRYLSFVAFIVGLLLFALASQKSWDAPLTTFSTAQTIG